MNIENIIALIAAASTIAVPLISVWRLFVRGDNRRSQQRHDLAIAEQKATREAQQEQNALLTKILANGESSMGAVIGVINAFTKANAQRDILHEQESKRGDELLATLNGTIKQGQLQHSSDLQALTQVITTFGNKVNDVNEAAERIETTVNKAAVTIDKIASLVEQELNAVKISIGTLSESNGKLVTHEQVVAIQELFDVKLDDIMRLLKPENISHLPISVKKKGKDNEPTQPITADL